MKPSFLCESPPEPEPDEGEDDEEDEGLYHM